MNKTKRKKLFSIKVSTSQPLAEQVVEEVKVVVETPVTTPVVEEKQQVTEEVTVEEAVQLPIGLKELTDDESVKPVVEKKKTKFKKQVEEDVPSDV